MDVSSHKLDDLTIDELENRTLRARRNTLAPISRLPTEILSRIFITIAFSCFDSSNGTKLSWIRSVTAICSHWRAIALECPGLWCFISFKHPIWAEEMLKRSKEAPLIIIAIEGQTPQMMDALHLTFQHISRIKELNLVASKVNIGKLFDRIDNRAAPLLRSLCLSNTEFTANNAYKVPETLFISHGHHLERIELANCIISWDSPLLCGLVHLKFHQNVDGPRPTITQLLRALEKMPLLETLHLNGSLPIIVPGDSFRSLAANRVHLSHLTSLHLTSSAIECGYLLNHISYPASTFLGLRCTLSTTGDISFISDAMSSVWNGKDDSKLLCRLHIFSLSRKATILRGWITNKRPDAHRPTEPAQIEVALQWLQWTEISDYEAANATFDVCKPLKLTGLRSLFVTSRFHIPKAAWLCAFGHLTSLRTLHVHGYPVHGLMSALSTVLEENLTEEGDSTGKVFLSSLRHLWLKESNVMRTTFNSATFFEDLQDCLMTRCHWNAEVQSLHIGCTGNYCGPVGLLREIVVDVDWRVIGEPG